MVKIKQPPPPTTFKNRFQVQIQINNFKNPQKITKINSDSDKNAICENSFESKVEFLNSFAKVHVYLGWFVNVAAG